MFLLKLSFLVERIILGFNGLAEPIVRTAYRNLQHWQSALQTNQQSKVKRLHLCLPYETGAQER